MTGAKAAFAGYRERLARRAEGAPRRFRIHSLLFGASNAFLFAVNLVIGIGFPWFLFPLGTWAVVLAGHYALLRARRSSLRETEGLEELSPRDTGCLERLHRQRAAFALSLTGASGAALVLAMTNALISPEFPWAAVTAAGLGLAELFHYLWYGARRRRLLADLGGSVAERVTRSADSSTARRSRGAPAEPAELARAHRIRNGIAALLVRERSRGVPTAAEIAPLLDRFLEQLDRFVRERAELERLVHEAGPERILAERDRLDAAMRAARSDELRKEYERAARQLDDQLASVRKLEERAEIAEVRIDSAISSLEKLEIDLARLESIAGSEETAAGRALAEKSRELSQYLEDFAKGRSELDELS